MSPAATQTIESEVSDATGVTAKDGEARSKYLARLVRAADKLEEEEWAELSQEATDWVNAGNKAVNEGEACPEPPDAEASADAEEEEADEDEDEESDDDESDDEEEAAEAAAKDDEEDEEEEDEEEAPVAKKKAAKKTKAKADEDEEPEEKPAKKAKAEKPAKDEKKQKKEKAPKPEKAPAAGSGLRNSKSDKGAADAWRALVVKYPDKSREKLAEMLDKKGMKLHPGRMQFIRSEALKVLKLLKPAAE